MGKIFEGYDYSYKTEQMPALFLMEGSHIASLTCDEQVKGNSYRN